MHPLDTFEKLRRLASGLFRKRKRLRRIQLPRHIRKLPKPREKSFALPLPDGKAAVAREIEYRFLFLPLRLLCFFYGVFFPRAMRVCKA